MPIFEYSCDQCGKQFSALVGVLANARQPVCPKCSGSALTKRVSRFARVRSEDDAMDALADDAAYGDIENDPKAMRKFVRDMGSALDEDLDEDFEAALEEEMSGGASDGSANDETVY